MLEAKARELSLIKKQIRKEFLIKKQIRKEFLNSTHANLYSEFMRSHRLWIRYKFVRDFLIEEIN